MIDESNSWNPSCAVALVLGIAASVVEPSTVFAEADAERGLSIATQWCNSCHIVQQDDPGMDDAEIGPRFSTLTDQTAETLKRLLAPGHEGMDALSKLTDSDLADIAAHLKRLKPQLRTPR